MAVELSNGKIWRKPGTNMIVINNHLPDTTFEMSLETFRALITAYNKMVQNLKNLRQSYKEETYDIDLDEALLATINEHQVMRVVTRKWKGQFYLSVGIFDKLHDGEFHWRKEKCLRLDARQDDLEWALETLGEAV